MVICCGSNRKLIGRTFWSSSSPKFLSAFPPNLPISSTVLTLGFVSSSSQSGCSTLQLELLMDCRFCPQIKNSHPHKSQQLPFIFQVQCSLQLLFSFGQALRPSNNFFKSFTQILDILSSGQLIHHYQKLEPHYALLHLFKFVIFYYQKKRTQKECMEYLNFSYLH